jgi:hypothetical protein
MVPQSTASLAPALDAAEARWAADELTGLIARVGSDSVAGMILTHAQQELRSVVRSASARPEVVGPLRIHRAA